MLAALLFNSPNSDAEGFSKRSLAESLVAELRERVVEVVLVIVVVEECFARR